MPSIVETVTRERAEFLRQYRTAYLRSVGAELGVADLRWLALREARAMIEVAEEMDARPWPLA